VERKPKELAISHMLISNFLVLPGFHSKPFALQVFFMCKAKGVELLVKNNNNDKINL